MIAAHGDYIRQETLSNRLLKESPAEGAYTKTDRVNGFEVTLGVVRD